MPRPSLSVRACAGLLTGAVLTLGLGVGTPSAGVSTGSTNAPRPSTVSTGSAVAAHPGEDESPLRVTIEKMTPGTLPAKGAVRIRGVVTNTDDEAWTNVRMFPFAGTAAPMTTTEELAVAADTDPTAVVGPRITDVMDVVGDLEPGESAPYRIRLPRKLIDVTAPGIYWFGVHALGQAEDGIRDVVADGRARTFLPYLPQSDTDAATPTSIVVPLRAQIDHTRRGAIAHPRHWRRQLERGSLRRLVDFGAAAAGRPVTWLLDPALLDVVDRLRVGNPERSISPTISARGDADEPQVDADSARDAPAETLVAERADAWLTDTRAALRGSSILTLPYGDLDVAAAAEHDPTTYATARAQRGRLVEEWRLTGQPTVNAPDGYLDDDGFSLIDDHALTLLTDRAFPPEQFPDGAPATVSVDGHRAVVTSDAAASGGPGPDPRRSAVAMRQRILSEAAARVFETGGATPRPLLVKLPRALRGEPDAFWDGLDQPWVDLITADGVAGTSTAVTLDQLTYPRRRARAELDGEAFAAAEEIIDRAPVFQDLLTLNNAIADRLTAEALTGLGHNHRDDQNDTVARLREIEAWTYRRLNDVSVIAPPGVTLASGSGEFAVTLRNDLDQPVTLGIRGRSPGATVDPVEPRVVPPQSHTTVFLSAHAADSGVHNVDLALVTAEGVDLGVGTSVPVRSGQASVVIWWILGSGGGLLALALGIRLARRSRGAAAGATDTGAAVDPTPGASP